MKTLHPEIKKLVLWRLKNGFPAKYKLSLGSHGIFSKEQLREHIMKEDEVGRIYIDLEMRFINSLCSGSLSKFLSE